MYPIRLEHRAESLGAAADTSRELDAGLARLKNALHAIGDKLDDVTEHDPHDQLREVEVRELRKMHVSKGREELVDCFIIKAIFMKRIIEANIIKSSIYLYISNRQKNI